MKKTISITGIGSISPLGSDQEAIWKAYQKDTPYVSVKSIDQKRTVVADLQCNEEELLKELSKDTSHYKDVDKTVLMSVFAARKAMAEAKWSKGGHFGVNIGSSRGATELFEKYHAEYLDKTRVATLCSPTTTLGNISSWVANDLLCEGPEISHSITCSTALHSILNGVAWIQSEMTDKFMVGGSEAPLTSFTIAQMRALKIYTQECEAFFPCRTLDYTKQKNQMFLGEGAAVFCLEGGVVPNAKALITGVGYATELLKHNISISTNADCFQKSMRMAIGKLPLEEVDVIIMHSPGTIKGDLSEYNAIKAVFGEQIPFLTGNKWKIGHSFGASGALSLEMAILLLEHQEVISVPFIKGQIKPNKINNIIVNSVGFGGNSVSILLKNNM